MIKIGVYDLKNGYYALNLIKELFLGSNLNGLRYEAINLDNDFDFSKSPHFDIVFLLHIYDYNDSNCNLMFQQILKNNVIIVNADEPLILNCLKGHKGNIITCGFNKKASATASSVQQYQKHKTIQYCIQRSFQTLNGDEIEAQEFPVKLPSLDGEGDIITELSVVTAALVLGADKSFLPPCEL